MTTRQERAVPPGPQARAARGPAGPAHGGRGHGLVAQDRRLGYILVAPLMIALLAVTAYPLLYNLWNSFRHDDYQNPTVTGFAGFANYAKLFNSIYLFVPSLEHTIGFTIVSVAVEASIGLAIALALNKPFRGRGIVRAAVIIPWAVPTVISGVLWKIMFDPQQGFVNYTLTKLHLPLASTTWLDEKWTAWTALLIADAWRNTPFVAIILLAGLQVIPQDIYEAARIDGASAWQTFRRLTLPLLAPALSVALIFRTLSSFMIFDVVYVMTGGGPGTSTYVLSFLDYQAFQVDLNYGFGGAVSIAMIIMALLIAAVYTRVFRVEQQT